MALNTVGAHEHPTTSHGSGEAVYRNLLSDAEVALVGRDIATALPLFERAASMRHAADSELGVIRTYMQAGQFRQALAFAAHTAAAHREGPQAAVFYALLLGLGGQRHAMQVALGKAASQWPRDTSLEKIIEALSAPTPRIPYVWLAAPGRLAPYSSAGIPSQQQSVGTGVLMADGTRVVVPIALLARHASFWIRNGVGDVALASTDKRLPGAGIAVLRLAQPFPVHPAFVMAARPPFPGSPAYTIEYVPASASQPQWPWLHAGFVGRPTTRNTALPLQIDLPDGPRGGPVFDASGQFTGIALPGSPNKLLDLTPLDAKSVRLTAHFDPTRRVATDEIYEVGLLHSVQVVAAGRAVIGAKR